LNVSEVEAEKLAAAPALQEVDLTDNPLMPESHSALLALPAPRVRVSDLDEEEWNI